MQDLTEENVLCDGFTRKMLDHLNFPAYIIDARTHIIKLANRTAGDVEGKNHFLAYFETRSCSNDCYIEKIIRSKLPSSMHKHVMRGGQQITIEIYSSPILDDDGKVMSIIEYYIDITNKLPDVKCIDTQNKYQDIIETNNDFIWETDNQLRYNYCSPQMEMLWGYKPHEMIGKIPFFAMEQETSERKEFIANLIKNPQAFTGVETRSLDANGNPIVVEANGVPIFDQKGTLVGYRGITRDITSKKIAEDALKKREEEYRRLIENSNSIILKVDRNLNLTFMNDFGLRFFGYTKEELIGKNIIGTIMPHKDSEGNDLSAMTQEIIKNPTSHYTNVNQNVKKNGEIVWITWTNAPKFDNEGNLESILGIGNDITKLKEVEKKLRASERRFRNIIKYAPTLIFEVNLRTHKFTTVNDIMCEYLGYTREELMALDPINIIDDEYKEFFSERGRKWLNNEKPDEVVEAKLVTKDKKTRYVNLHTTFMRDKFGNPFGLMAVGHDITQRKEVEHALRDNMTLLDTILSSMNDAVLTLDNNWNVIGLNDAFAKFCRFENKDEFQKVVKDYRKIFRMYTIQGTEMPIEHWPAARALRGEIGSGYEFIMERPDCNEKWYANISFAPLKDKKGKMIGAVTTMQDITKQKKSELTLQTLVLEKETLLKEIHHRVKNNMQIIYSLMNMQARRSENSDLKHALDDSQSRIKSMALVHETLYKSESISNVSMNDYIKNILTYLSESYKKHEDISINVDIDAMPLEISKAISCGLIVNELVSNSLKYAFLNRPKGNIDISLKKELSEAVLIISDDGVGLPCDFNSAKCKSLGMQLVETLTKQLEGNMELLVKEGTKYVIRFPLQRGDKND